VALFSFGKPTHSVGLDIGTRSIRVAQLALGKQPPVLDKVGIVRIPENLVVDGEIADIKAVSALLKDLWAKNGFAKNNLTVGVANQKVIVRVIDMPHMNEEELKGAIRYQAADYIPMPVEETIIDFEILKEYSVKDDEKNMKVLLVAAQRDMIQAYVEALGNAGLYPTSIDVKSFAMMRSMIPSLPAFPSEEQLKSSMETTCLLNVGAGVSNMIIVEEGMPYFVRILLFGGNDFTRAISENMGITEEDAEDLKISLSEPGNDVIGGGTIGDEKREARQKAEDIMTNRISSFVREIRRSIDYCLDQTGCRAPESIVLSGRGSKIKGMKEELERALAVTVREGQPLQNVKVGKMQLTETDFGDIEPALAVPVGLALRGVEK
jgi:type IV pilus assembly protein PilM